MQLYFRRHSDILYAISNNFNKTPSENKSKYPCYCEKYAKYAKIRDIPLGVHLDY
jgi:hypothetical protein